jgi:hypothetical protein
LFNLQLQDVESVHGAWYSSKHTPVFITDL